MRLFLSLVAYAASLIAVAAVAFVAVLLGAGPHSGVLPAWAETTALAVGWLAVAVVPLVGRIVWRRLGS